MKYKVEIYYPDKLVEYATGEEVDHYEIGWCWKNGPAIQVENMIMRTINEKGEESFSIFPHSPDTEIDILSIIYHFMATADGREKYTDDDIFSYGAEELTIGEVREYHWKLIAEIADKNDNKLNKINNFFEER